MALIFIIVSVFLSGQVSIGVEGSQGVDFGLFCIRWLDWCFCVLQVNFVRRMWMSVSCSLMFVIMGVFVLIFWVVIVVCVLMVGQARVVVRISMIVLRSYVFMGLFVMIAWFFFIVFVLWVRLVSGCFFCRQQRVIDGFVVGVKMEFDMSIRTIMLEVGFGVEDKFWRRLVYSLGQELWEWRVVL